MDLYYFQGKPPNFGDELNAYLWPKVFPNLGQADGKVLIGFGTILDSRIDETQGDKIIFGTGIRYGNKQPKFDKSYDIRFVRGPLSSQELGNDTQFITDSALCLRFFEGPAINQSDCTEIGFMPHFRTNELVDFRTLCQDAGLTFIDPSKPVRETLDTVKKVKVLFSEAMHGVIIADMFRIPWKRVKCFSHIHEKPEVAEFKWKDWSQSMNVDLDPTNIQPLTKYWRRRYKIFQHIANKFKSRKLLSDLTSLKSQLEKTQLTSDERIEEAIHQLKTATLTLGQEYNLEVKIDG